MLFSRLLSSAEKILPKSMIKSFLAIVEALEQWRQWVFLNNCCLVKFINKIIILVQLK